MKNVQQLLDALADKAGSDRRAALELLGITQGAMSKWRRGVAFPDDEQALKIADALKMPHAAVLLIVRADRTTSRKARAVWLQLAEAFGKAASIGGVALTAALACPHTADAAVRGLSCVLCQIKRRAGFLTNLAA